MRLAFVGFVALISACDPGGPSVKPSDPRAQPGATLLPLETAGITTPDGGLAGSPDGGLNAGDAAPPAPEPLEPFAALAPDRLPETVEGLRLEGQWRWRSDGPWPENPEANAEAIASVRSATTSEWAIEIATAGRLRVEIAGRGQSLPPGSLLLAHADHYGSVVVWPESSRYRVLVPGTLKNALGDRRADITPLTPGSAVDQGRSERLGLTTRKVLVRSATAQVQLELATVERGGRGAPLLCRMLLEVAGVEPSSPVCVDPELVLAADFAWSVDGALADGPGIRFEVIEVRDAEIGGDRLAMPPSQARFSTNGLPGASRLTVLSSRELEALRRAPAPPAVPLPDDSPERGLEADNRSDRLMFLTLDGAVAAMVPPWEKTTISTLKNGSYTIQWRSFWGETLSPATPIEVPGRVVFGAGGIEKPDAG